MLLRSLVVVGLVGLVSLAMNKAVAEDAIGPNAAIAAVDGVSFADPYAFEKAEGGRFRLTAGEAPGARFSRISAETAAADASDHRSYELALARSGLAGLPVDVEIAQRANFGVNEAGDISRSGSAAELRLGRGLGDLSRRQASSWSRPIWYIFAAAEDEALTWQPGARSAFGGAGNAFALQDRIEIGDIQAGVTIEAGPLQASLAYVEREISTHWGAKSFSRNENFAGVTLTMRH